jgi:DNA repair protein RadC
MENVMNFSKVNMVAEVELVYKSKVKASERPQIKTSKDCYDLLKLTWDEGKIELVEQFKVVLLNRAQRVMGIYEMSSGGTSSTVADPRLIFTAALKMNAINLILSHSHPSGTLQPSNADIALTKKLSQAGQLLEISVLDHIIVTAEGYYSFADEGIL